MCNKGLHSFACHPHTNHTCLHCPVARPHCLLARTHCAYQWGMARLSWPGWLVTYRINVRHRELNPDTVTHPSTTRIQCRLTSLIKSIVLPLCQTTTSVMVLRNTVLKVHILPVIMRNNNNNKNIGRHVSKLSNEHRESVFLFWDL